MPLTDDPGSTVTASLSLTRREAEQRAATIVVQHTDVTLDLTRPGSTFDSVSTVRFSLADGVAAGAETFVDFKGQSLVAVELNGTSLDPATWNQGRIP